jgi:hypothetical protein
LDTISQPAKTMSGRRPRMLSENSHTDIGRALPRIT